MNHKIKQAMDNSPIIAAIKDDAGLEKCLACDSDIIFILYGTIVSISDIVDKIKSVGKIAIIHIDLIQGLSPKDIAVDFIHKYTKADGIISTKPSLIHRAKELELFTIMRFFVIDSMAFYNIQKQLQSIHPDVIEILPALMPKIITKICHFSQTPVIAGGLISEKEDVIHMIDAGAICISSTNESVWFL